MSTTPANRATIAMFALSLALGLGCNTSTVGDEGNIRFAPADCGRASACNFASGLGTGGTARVQIEGIDGFNTAGINLEAFDPKILAVTKIADVSGKPAWEIHGMASGTTRLLAINPAGKRVDSIFVDVVDPARLTMVDFGNHATGPQTGEPGYDEQWSVDAGERIIFLVTPVDGNDQPLMGRYKYTPVIEVETFDSFIQNVDGLGAGTLDFIATMVGEYGVRFHDIASDTTFAVLIEVVDNQ